MNAVILKEYQRTRTKAPDYPAKWALIYAQQWAEIQEIEAREDIRVSLSVEPDHEEVRGNAIASGDDAFDRRVEDGIIARLEAGDAWAWGVVTVSVSRVCDHCGEPGETVEEYLGCCSYRDAEDFKRGGYYFDMLKTCLSNLGIES